MEKPISNPEAARRALGSFAAQTGSDDALADLLTGLVQLCETEPGKFDDALKKAKLAQLQAFNEESRWADRELGRRNDKRNR